MLDLVLTTLPGRAPETLQEAAKSAAEAARQAYAAPNLRSMFDFIEVELATRPWFTGEEFSSADVMMSFPLEAGGARAGAFEGRRKVEAFVERIHARPAYRRALARGVLFTPGEHFLVAPDAREGGALRLNFSAASPDRAARGLAILAELIREG